MHLGTTSLEVEQFLTTHFPKSLLTRRPVECNNRDFLGASSANRTGRPASLKEFQIRDGFKFIVVSKNEQSGPPPKNWPSNNLNVVMQGPRGKKGAKPTKKDLDGALFGAIWDARNYP